MFSNRLFRTVRTNWKKSVAGVAAGIWVTNYATSTWRSAIERDRFAERARAIGRSPLKNSLQPPRKMAIIVNRSTAGDGTALALLKKEVLPLFQLAGIDYVIHKTQFASDARLFVEEMNLDNVDGILSVGGDGTLQAVVTGLFKRSDMIRARSIPIGVIPAGLSNQFLRLLHVSESTSRTSLAGESAMAIIENKTRKVDVIAMTTAEGLRAFSLSTFGWGALGNVGFRSYTLRWPGQRRYGVAGLLSLYMDGVPNSKGTIRLADPNSGWADHDFESNLVVISKASSHPMFGCIDPKRTLEDGLLSVIVLPNTLSRTDLIRITRRCKGGTSLVEACDGICEPSLVCETNNLQFLPDDSQAAEGVKLTEDDLDDTDALDKKFKKGDRYYVDGESFDANRLSIQVLPKLLTVFAMDPQ